MFKAFFIFVILCVPALAQQSVILSSRPEDTGYTQVSEITSGKITAVCTAKSVDRDRLTTTVSISAATNANPVVFTTTHGLPLYGTRPSVVVAGGTGSWTAVNGTFVATIVDSTHFSIVVDSTSFGALAGTVTFATTAPRLTVAEWAVQRLAYDSGGIFAFSGWLYGATNLSKCSDASVATVPVQ